MAEIKLIHIPLAPFDNEFGTQRLSGSKDNRIDPKRIYLAKCDGIWRLGKFNKQWYGWIFDYSGWSNTQLDMIEDLYLVESFPDKQGGVK